MYIYTWLCWSTSVPGTHLPPPILECRSLGTWSGNLEMQFMKVEQFRKHTFHLMFYAYLQVDNVIYHCSLLACRQNPRGERRALSQGEVQTNDNLAIQCIYLLAIISLWVTTRKAVEKKWPNGHRWWLETSVSSVE